MLGCNAQPNVAHADEGMSVSHADSALNLSPLRRVLERVVQEVGDDHRYPEPVAADQHLSATAIQDEDMTARKRPEHVDLLLGDKSQVKRLA